MVSSETYHAIADSLFEARTENNTLRAALKALLRQYEVDWQRWAGEPANFAEIRQAREALGKGNDV